MLSCKQATRLISQSQDRDLSIAEKLQLKLHLAMCKGCMHFQSQMGFLRRACSGYLKRQGFKDGE